MKTFKKSLSVVLAALMLICAAIPAFAAEEITVSLRVEGIEKCLFYGDVSVAKDATAFDALKAAADKDESLTLTTTESQYGIYLAAINDLYAGSQTEKGWDGWMFRVNDEAISVSMDQYTVKADDRVVVYYSDEYGETGMLYPVADTSKLADGKLSFTSTVTEYDANWNMTEKEVVITGATLIWDGEKLTADENGVYTIPFMKLLGSEHNVQLERYAENKLPNVLRFAPDYTLKVEHTNILAKLLTFFVDLFAKVRALFVK